MNFAKQRMYSRFLPTVFPADFVVTPTMAAVLFAITVLFILYKLREVYHTL